MQNKLGIACIAGSFYPIIGGLEIQLKGLAKFLYEQGIDITIYTYPIEGASSNEEIEGIEVIRPKVLRSKGFLTPLSFMFAVSYRIFKNRKRYSIFQAHFLPMGIIAGIIGKLLGKKSIVKIEAVNEIQRYRKSRLKTAILRSFVDRFITMGSSTTRELMSIGIPERKIVNIPNAFDLSFLNVKNSSQGNNKKIVIFVGRLEEEKAPEVLINAWHIVSKKHPDAILTMLGDGKKRYELESLIAELKLSGTVEIKGFVNNVKEYLSNATIFVLPSRTEGISIAMLEAMASGVSVIVTPVGDIPDIIKNGENGIFVNSDDINSLAEAISELLNCPEKRHRLAEKAMDTVQAFSMEQVGRLYMKLYADILHEK